MLGGNVERDFAMQQIALRSARRRDFKGATRAIGKIGQPAITAGAYAGLAEAQARAGDQAAARQSFSRAESAASRAHLTLMREAGRAYAYKEIGKAHGRLGDRAAAIAAFDKGLASARKIDGESMRDNVIADNAAARAEAGDFDGALRALQEVNDWFELRKARVPIPVAIVRTLAEAGQHERAMAAAAAIRYDDMRALGFAAIGAVEFRRGNTARATQAFERAVEEAKKRPGDRLGSSFSDRDSTLLRVAEAQARAGDEAGALRTAAHVVRHSPNADRYITDAVYSALATGQAEAGDAEAALRTVALVKAYTPHREMWRALGVVAGRRGEVDTVLARGPEESGRRAALLLGLAEGLIARAEETRRP